MAYINIILFSIFSFAKTDLLELTAKQNIQTLRLFYKKNDSNFYQRGKGSLAFSSNYKAFQVLNDDISSQYGVTTFDNSTFLLWKKFDINRVLSPAKDAEIFLYNIKEKKPERIGNGVSPQFHNDGKYFSYYSYTKKVLTVTKLDNRSRSYSIKINSKSPYFSPEVKISSKGKVYFTDQNDKMNMGLLSFDMESRKRELIYKLNEPTVNLSLCSTEDNLYILESSATQKSFTNLYRFSHLERDISKRDFLFQSSVGPAHSLICNVDKERIYMIKGIHGVSGNISELISYKFSDKKAYIHSDLKFVTNAMPIENEIYIPFRKKIYTLKDKEGKFVINKELVEKDE
ncbi:MAG: hypothetical protein BM556_13640 [Bacteriovorax sp. MedPE-SWde]|nr:MAG: hypothetical protein BM556_13640 [Bacteriovorax sp. MedPE-SWde]